MVPAKHKQSSARTLQTREHDLRDEISALCKQFSAWTLDPRGDQLTENILEEEHAALHFLGLPDELQKSVLDYVTRYSDLRTLCTVSKRLRALTLPYLYRTVVLYISSSDDHRLSSFTADNPGLALIRTLRIKQDIVTNSIDSGNKSSLLYQLIALLPKNGLRRFEVTTMSEIHQDLGLLLRTRQQRLTNYQYHGQGVSSTPLIPMANEVRHVTCLDLYLGDMQDIQTARLLFDRMTSVTRLTISACLDGPRGGHAAFCRDAVNTIFAPGNTTNRSIKLSHLRLVSMELKDVGTTLPHVLPFDNLTHLHLSCCCSTDVLCKTLSQLNLNLQSFCDECPSNAPKSGALDPFLRSLLPLQQLRIHHSARQAETEIERFNWTALTSHAPHLRCLDLRDPKFGTDLFIHATETLPDFLAFCKSASNLQQLSIVGPKMEKSTWSNPHGLYKLLCCLRNLSSLRLLKINDSPVCLDMPSFNPFRDDMGPGSEYMSRIRLARDQAKIAADHIFDSLAQACPRLVAIMIYHVKDDFLLQRVYFLRSKKTDPAGNVRFVGHLVDKQTLRDSVQCCGVLDSREEDILEY